jgi:DNA repair protein RAD50
MQEYTESDEELCAMRDSFGKRNAEAVEKVREAGARREEVGQELGRVRDELGQKTVEMGGLEEARRAHQRSLARREEVVKEVAARHGFVGMGVIMEDAQIEEIRNLLFQALKEEKGKLDKLKV